MSSHWFIAVEMVESVRESEVMPILGLTDNGNSPSISKLYLQTPIRDLEFHIDIVR